MTDVTDKYYKNGNRHGQWEYWDFNIKRTATFFDGYDTYHESFRYVGSYDNGQKVGLWELYDTNKILLEEEVFIT